MDHVIALDWGRFSGESESAPQEGGRKKDGTQAKSVNGNSSQSVLDRLQNALALPPEPGLSLYAEELNAHAANASFAAPQRASNTKSPVQESPAGNAAQVEQSAAARASRPYAANSASGSERAAASEGSTYQNRLMWMGTGFEERRVLITPPPAAMAAPEPQPAPVLAETSVEMLPENATVEAPSMAMLSATAAAAEPQTQEKVEAMPIDTLPSLIPDTSLNTNEGQMAPHADAAVSVLEPSNGSKIAHGADHSDGGRWYMLNGLLGGAPAPEQTPADASAGNVPVLEVFSLAGGVGKTSLVATLGRTLSGRGESVLLVEAADFSFLPFFFGASDCRPGVLRTFRPPASSMDAPIRLATVDSESLHAGTGEQDSPTAKFQEWGQGARLMIVDVATGSSAAVGGLSAMSPTVLVPLFPDVNSLVTAQKIESFFRQRAGEHGAETEIYYVLNQFDPSVLLHMEVAKALHSALGERLLPFALERDPAVSEALADGMTIVDYAPGSPLVENFNRLAEWVELVVAPARANAPSARWSER
jgi:cellulose synthase operon protein YhjQ